MNKFSVISNIRKNSDKKFQVHFAVSNKEEFSSEIEQNGLGERKDSDKPIVVILTDEGKFPMDNEFRYVSVWRFVPKIENFEEKIMRFLCYTKMKFFFEIREHLTILESL